MCNRGILFLLISSSSRSLEAWSPERWIPARSHLTMLQRLLEFRRPLMPKVIKTPNKLTDIKRNKYPSPSPPQAALCSWVNLLMSLKKPPRSVLPTKGSVCADLGASLAPQLQVVNTVLEIKMLKCPLFGEQRLRARPCLRGSLGAPGLRGDWRGHTPSILWRKAFAFKLPHSWKLCLSHCNVWQHLKQSVVVAETFASRSNN